MYTNITGAFPVRSFKSMQYIFVAYVCDLSAIIVRAMPSRTDASMVTPFTKLIATLKSSGYMPSLNMMDNECSAAVKKYIRSEKIIIQLIPPYNHRVNAAKRAIATFKEHFVAALATVDTHCPLQLWDDFLSQVELTLNMLRFSWQDPKKSANQEVYGSFDFNKTPLVPLGTKALIYDDPASRASWVPHATDGFYLGPASDHYRCLHFYIPAIRCFRFSDTWRLYPTHSQVPIALQNDLSIAVATNLLKVFGTNLPALATVKCNHVRAIQELMAIMTRWQATLLSTDSPDTRVGAPDQRVKHTPPPRVATTLNNITAPNVIRQMPLVHQCHTCNNNPSQILAAAANDDVTVLASNCSSHVPTPNLQTSDLPGNPPALRRTRQLANQPTNPPPSLQLSSPLTMPPPRARASPSIIPTITPMTPHTHIHDLQPKPPRRPKKNSSWHQAHGPFPTDC
jgi:hypothetical protein